MPWLWKWKRRFMSKKNVQNYRVEGMSCANCAKIFEKNVEKLAGVKEARVNFGASKISVQGSVTIEALEQAGSFENLTVRNERERKVKKESIWKQKSTIKVYIAALLLALTWLISSQLGESHLLVTLGYAAVIVIGGYSLFIQGLKNLRQFIFDMNTLMTIAIIGAALIGQWSEGAMVVILFAISEALEKYSINKARASIESLMDIAPREAFVRRGGEEIKIAVEEIQIGDIMIVKPGQQLAMDGFVSKGVSTVNQAAITGESVPVKKMEKDEVFAGTLNHEGLLEVEVTKKVEDTALAKIIHLVEEAQAERAPSQSFVDRFAEYYTPFIMILAFLIAIVPPLFFGGSWEQWVYQGLAVLVVGCPCALVVSTPVAVVTAIGNAAKNGVLIKGGIHLEEAGKLDVIAFDKTGTLTKGVPVVTDIVSYEMDEDELLSLTAVIEKNSQHPLASAIIKEAEAMKLAVDQYEIHDFQSLTGQGVRARIEGQVYYVASPTFFFEAQGEFEGSIEQEIIRLQEEGKTVMILGTKERIEGLIAVADEIRSSSKKVIKELNAIGIETLMLTGDNERTAAAIGEELEISQIQAELMPEDKLAVIESFQKLGKKVGMIGDGVNDAPALAASDLGVAMAGAGTDTALETADIALMSDDLNQLPYSMGLSQKALAIIKQNISFALGLKLIALLLVVPGWLTLWIAVFSDMGATVMVTLNSLRLLRKPKKR